MRSHRDSPPRTCARDPHPHRPPRSSFWRRWFLANTFLSGCLALCWLVLRSGTKPSRLAYPCQRAAISTAMLALGGPALAIATGLTQNLVTSPRSRALGATAVSALLLLTGIWGYRSQAGEYAGPRPAPPLAYRAALFHVAGCPLDPAGDRFLGLDNLLAVMGRGGLKLHASITETPVAGAGGIISTEDVVVIKINYQWDQRGGTNMDLLRGLIRRILDHPDGFEGEVIVCENTQFASTGNFDRAWNNAQDQTLSPHDVVLSFQTLGYNVSLYDWAAIRFTNVGEYEAADMQSGYIVHPYDANVLGRVSYPKFQSASGTYVSLRYGIWDPATETYDRERLEFINVPVLKSHHASYGATASVKHYMGVVTGELATSSHSAIRYGIMGTLLGEIQLADLNIMDAIWINANPHDGPWTSYSGATRRDELVASVDPVALDLWAVKNILIPGFLQNGYSPPWPYPSADPDNPSSAFRQYLDNSMYQILAAGYEVTNDLAQIDVLAGNGAAGDFDGDSDVDGSDLAQFATCFTGPGGGPPGPGCAAGDFDGDDDVDCDDWELFQDVWTEATPPPPLAACATIAVSGPATTPRATSLSRAFPNPTNPTARIAYAIGVPGHVRLKIFDVTGRSVRTLVDDTRGSGQYTILWDGRNDRGLPVPRGVYTYQLEAPGFRSSEKIVVR